MKTLLLAFLSLLSVALPLQARLGETEAQIETRYGKSTRSENGATARDIKRYYNHGGINIMVTFLDGKSSCEEYTRDSYPNGGGFSDEDIQALLAANSMGLSWTKLEHEETDRTYDQNWRLGSREKPAAIANSKFFNTKLIVATPDYVDFTAARAEENKTKQHKPGPLEDF